MDMNQRHLVIIALITSITCSLLVSFDVIPAAIILGVIGVLACSERIFRWNQRRKNTDESS
ncbi:hypothetical protein A9Q81_02500 [Gammaproteobacteria bacterium 42_54_T18]|nr:hypothetical protein A9Q81_02500 [Gammaproteobacteria bacterium 42_54_T18]